MKFEMIAASDVDIIREARKALKRLQKRINKLDEKREAALGSKNKSCADYRSVANEEWRFLDELRALHIRAELNGDMSLEA